MDPLAELNRGIEQLLSRPEGPLSFRLIVQPLMATFLAVRAGVRDARERRPVFLWTLLTNPAERRGLARSAWKDIGKVIIMAFVIDGVYQLIELRTFYPLQSLIVAIVIALLPYVLLRGLVTRFVRAFFGSARFMREKSLD